MYIYGIKAKVNQEYTKVHLDAEKTKYLCVSKDLESSGGYMSIETIEENYSLEVESDFNNPNEHCELYLSKKELDLNNLEDFNLGKYIYEMYDLEVFKIEI